MMPLSRTSTLAASSPLAMRLLPHRLLPPRESTPSPIAVLVPLGRRLQHPCGPLRLCRLAIHITSPCRTDSTPSPIPQLQSTAEPCSFRHLTWFTSHPKHTTRSVYEPRRGRGMIGTTRVDGVMIQILRMLLPTVSWGLGRLSLRTILETTHCPGRTWVVAARIFQRAFAVLRAHYSLSIVLPPFPLLRWALWGRFSIIVTRPV